MEKPDVHKMKADAFDSLVSLSTGAARFTEAGYDSLSDALHATIRKTVGEVNTAVTEYEEFEARFKAKFESMFHTVEGRAFRQESLPDVEEMLVAAFGIPAGLLGEEDINVKDVYAIALAATPKVWK